MLGIVLIDKPQGISSHDAVNRVRRAYGTRRVGHAGTLDPQATGLLVMAVGPATRFLQYLPLEPKIYEATITFGTETITQDGEGEVVAEKPVPENLEEAIKANVSSLTGEIQQLPPLYSAIKKDGKPLYMYARKGEDVERQIRTVFIKSATLLGIEGNTATFRIICSGGTYIRTWAHDLGQLLGCGAYLSGLVRTAVGLFSLDDAFALDELEEQPLISLREALEQDRPIVELNATQERAIRNGQSAGAGRWLPDGIVAVADKTGEVFGMARVSENQLYPECIIPQGPEC